VQRAPHASHQSLPNAMKLPDGQDFYKHQSGPGAGSAGASSFGNPAVSNGISWPMLSVVSGRRQRRQLHGPKTERPPRVLGHAGAALSARWPGSAAATNRTSQSVGGCLGACRDRPATAPSSRSSSFTLIRQTERNGLPSECTPGSPRGDHWRMTQDRHSDRAPRRSAP
jgi:hypothetical protein